MFILNKERFSIPIINTLLLNAKDFKPVEFADHDDDDPYLVVAADKGTATFSDTANEISQNYKFWLGDGFASGGSNGYDHKVVGITALGATRLSGKMPKLL